MFCSHVPRFEWKNHPMTVPAVGPTVTGNLDIRVDYMVRVGMYEELGPELHLDLPVVIATVGTEQGKYIKLYFQFQIRKLKLVNYCQ